jgi:hypothetical protein
VIDFCPIGDIPAMVEKIQILLSDNEYYNERKEKIKPIVINGQCPPKKAKMQTKLS